LPKESYGRFPLWLAWGTIFRGWVLAEQGEVVEGIAQIRQVLAAFQTIQSRLLRPYNLALLADALGKAQRTEAGLATVDEALAAGHENGEYPTRG
jgi:predicted ATPase